MLFRSNIHPEYWDPKVTRYSPLDTYPLNLLLDNIAKGGTVTSRTFHWFERPFNQLTGSIDDIYTTSGLVTAASGAAASGTTVYVKPDSTGLPKIKNVREYDTIEIYSGSVYGSVRGYVTSVHYGTVDNSYFALVTTETDTNQVLAGTSLVWTITGRGEEEIHELADSITEHETEYSNYIQQMEESHTISQAELYEASRIEEDVKKDKEMDSLQRLNQRRELAFLEGSKLKLGDRYFTGGLRWFLNQYESGNIIDWRTDTTYSASTDTVLGGLLPFTKRLLLPLRQWSKPGSRKLLVCSQTVRNIIDECVLNSGMYQIDYGTDRKSTRLNSSH